MLGLTKKNEKKLNALCEIAQEIDIYFGTDTLEINIDIDGVEYYAVELTANKCTTSLFQKVCNAYEERVKENMSSVSYYQNIVNSSADILNTLKKVL